jgi:hypothetical protein
MDTGRRKGDYIDIGKYLVHKMRKTKGEQQNEKIRNYAWTRMTQKSPPPTDEKGAIDRYGLSLEEIQRLYEKFGRDVKKLNAYLKKKYGNYETKDATKLEDKDSVNFGSPSSAELSASPLPKTRKNRIPRMSNSSRSSSAPLPQNKTRRQHNRPVIYISKESRSSSGRSSSSRRSSSRRSSSRRSSSRSSGRSSGRSSSREPEKLFIKRRKPKGSFDDVRHSGHANNRAYIVKKITESQSL